MIDAMVERLLDAGERYWVQYYLDEIDTHLNRIGYYLSGYDPEHRAATCSFVRGILERWPFLREEIPIVDRMAGIVEDYDANC